MLTGELFRVVSYAGLVHRTLLETWRRHSRLKRYLPRLFAALLVAPGFVPAQAEQRSLVVQAQENWERAELASGGWESRHHNNRVDISLLLAFTPRA